MAYGSVNTPVLGDNDLKKIAPFIQGTQTANTYSWTGTTDVLEELVDGQTINYWLPTSYGGSTVSAPYYKDAEGKTQQSTNSGVVLNLTLKNGNTTGNIPVYWKQNTRLTSHYGAGCAVQLTYRKLVNISGYYYTGWWCDATYTDGNNYELLAYGGRVKAKAAISGYKILVGDTTGYAPLAAGVTFDVNVPIVYNGSNITVASGSNTQSWGFRQQAYNINFQTTISGWTGTNNAPVYIKGKLNGSIFTVDSTTPATCTVPTSSDGFDYMFLGMCTYTGNMTENRYIWLSPVHPISRYANGKFSTVNEMAKEALDKINGLEIGGRNLLISYLEAGGQTTKISDTSVRVGTSNADTYFYLKLGTIPVVAGKTYTFSFDVENLPTGGHLQFSIFSSGSGYRMEITENGRFSYTFTSSVAKDAGAKIILDDNGRFFKDTDYPLNVVFSNFKLEEGSIATTYSPAPEDAISYIDSKVIGASHGGTGQTSLNASANTLINALTEGTDNVNDNMYLITQHANGSTATYHRRKATTLWNYVKGKTDALYARLGADNNLLAHGNEFNFTQYAENWGAHIWFNYRIPGNPTDDDKKKRIKSYTFGNGLNNSTGVTVNAETFKGNLIGNADTATIADSANLLKLNPTGRPTSANLSLVGDGSMKLLLSTASMTEGKPYTTGYINHYEWDNKNGYSAQLFVPTDKNNHMQFRGMTSGEWGNWKTVLDSTNYSDYALSLTGGTLTGDLTTKLLLSTPVTNATQSKIRILPTVSYQRIDSTHQNDTYFKALLKWICQTYPTDTNTIYIGSETLNSSVVVTIFIYSNSTVDATTGLPQHALGFGITLNNALCKFGTYNYSYYYYNQLDAENYKSYVTPANIGALASNGTAVAANKLSTARNISLGTAVTSTATAFDGSKDITIPVTGVKEAYLSWGGTNLNGYISPLDAAASNLHSANRLAFGKPAGITIEYSRDNGTTWIDYGATDSRKQNLVSGIGDGFSIGNRSSDVTIQDKLRVTLDSNSMKVYTRCRKLLMNVSSNGATGCTVTVETSTIGSPDNFTTYSTNSISGWSGWNSIPMSFPFGGSASQTSQIKRIRLTFSIAGLASNTAYKNNLSLLDLYMIGDTYWDYNSIMAKTGHLYSYDSNQNATFPANITTSADITAKNITATKFNGPATQISDSGDGRALTLAYSKSGLGTTGVSWFAAWNGNELRAISPANVRQNMSALSSTTANGYEGMGRKDGNTSDWIRTTSAGIIPYQSGGAGAGHSGLGTDSWYFSSAYIDTVNATKVWATTEKMNLSAGLIKQVSANSKCATGLFADGIAISNPTTRNDQGWIRVLGTGESDTTLEIATGDDGGAGEQIVVRQYNTNNAVTREAKLLDYSGNTTFPGTVTATALQLNGDIKFTGVPTLHWNDGNYQQRIRIIDDSTADTNVFEFQQSADAAKTWSTLFAIKDNGKVVADSFVGSLTGNATTATTATNLKGFTNTTSSATAIDNATQNGHVYVNGTSDIYNASDGAAFVHAYSTSWVAQIYQDYKTGQIALRGKNNGTWQDWRKVLDSSNYSTWALPKSGGTLTGSLSFATDSWPGTIYGKNAAGQKRWEMYSNSTSGAVADFKIRVYNAADGSTFNDFIFGTNGTLTATAFSGNLTGDVTGTATTATQLKNYYTTRQASANLAVTGDGTVKHFLATRSMSTGRPTSEYREGYITHYEWDNTGGYSAQLFLPAAADEPMQFRGMTTKTWGDWRVIIDSANYSNYALPKTGGTITGDLTVNGTLTATLQPSSISKTGYIAYPSGGYHKSTTEMTGMLKIILPQSWTDTMVKFTVSIYNNATDSSVDYIISGYTYSKSSKWFCPTATCIGHNGTPLYNLPVSFGHDGSKCCVTIGTTTTKWDYPQVNIHSITVGYQNTELDKWTSGWGIDFITSNPTTVTTTINTSSILRDALLSTTACYARSPGDLVNPRLVITTAPSVASEGGRTWTDVNRIQNFWMAATNQANVKNVAGNTYQFYLSGSDIRLKENIRDSETDAMSVIDQIKVRAFDWKKSASMPYRHQEIGFVADELEEIDPLLTHGGGYDADGGMVIKSVDSYYLQGLEVRNLQMLNKENKELRAENEAVKAEVSDLKSRLARLEALLS